MLGVKGRSLNEKERSEVRELKQIIYEGFLRALRKGVPKQKAGILTDEEFGASILRDAKKRKIVFAVCMEKSGQKEFDFQYFDWRQHVRKLKPSFAKVLVRYNPENTEINLRQLRKLKALSDFLHANKTRFLFELLVPPTEKQLRKCKKREEFDSSMRPYLMLQAMREIQNHGIEPDVWKIEGTDEESEMHAVVEQAKGAGVIVLGRGESEEKVEKWLRVGAETSGVNGFAVGRTVFWSALERMRKKKITRQRAVQEIAVNYSSLVKLWKKYKTKRKQ
jgi:5-dehydro-2-deoxygluconokinase